MGAHGPVRRGRHCALSPYGPASYIRLWAPDPEDPSKEYQRGYTIASLDEANEQMTLEFVLHDPAGPACTWAQGAQPGDQIAATRWGAPRFMAPTPAPAGYLLVGDPAALPGINGILNELPDGVPIEVYLEYTYDDERTLPIVERSDLQVTWVRRTGDPDELARAIAVRDYSDWFAWVTAETEATKAVRSRLKEWGFPKSHLKAQGYWKQGKEMGKSRDDGPVIERPDDEAPIRADQTPAARWQAAAGTELLRPLRRPLIVAGVAQALISLATLVPLVLLVELASLILDDVRDADRYWTLGWWALGILAAVSVAAATLLFALHVMDARFGHTVRTALVDRVSRVPLGWFTDRNSAAVRGRVHDDVTGLHHLTTHAVIDAVAAIVTPLAILIYLFVVHAGLAAFLLVPLLVAYVLSMRMYASASYGTEMFERHKDDVGAAASSHIDGLGTARIYDRGRGGRLGSALAERAAFVHSWQRPLIGVKIATDLVTRPTSLMAFVLLIGVPMRLAGWISGADLIAFLVVGTTVASRLLAVAYGLLPIREAREAAQRIARTLNEEVVAEAIHPSSLPAPAGGRHVRFRDVTFGYDAHRRALEGIDLDLPAGSVTALVGPSGAGKSTLASLLARFHDVDSGEVLIDDVDIRTLATDELYRTVAFVFQGQSLVRASLHDNIALARPNASRADVEAAARSARIHDRISQLDRGYDAVAGDDARLSGGEAQRVAVARAILADPAVLVLDEATAHADPESEHAVQMALGELVVGRTVLVVSHRLHTLTGADQLVVLDRGRIVQQGDHTTLVETDGLYRFLWDADAAAYDLAPTRTNEAIAR